MTISLAKPTMGTPERGAFDELKGLGCVEGQNLKIVVNGFGLRDEQFAEAAATLAKSAPDVIFCVGNPAMRAAQESTRTVGGHAVRGAWHWTIGLLQNDTRAIRQRY
jgi:hypothetical protein